MLTLSPLRLLAMFLLLVPSILVVTAAPLTDVDMAVQVEKRTKPKGSSGKITRSTIGITHTHCADPLIFVNTQRAYSPQANTNPNVFTGVVIHRHANKNIAIVDLTVSQKSSLYRHIEDNISGSSKWDYIFRVMQYMETNLKSFQFTYEGKQEWEEMWNECGGMEKPMEKPKTSGVPSSFENILVGGKAGPV
ncbi:uncharacterized protein C8R40DRAFT_1174149 [Lentinula edodes]|uniref:uncharacterized protein n=1 Tax=Lentinula edodes TaxID=5353 RepID=UPI001E8E8109|nr:uncharacterized protein C8R40DRAFT_1174149 [Lentinula edodes]KAH7871686.1 hypothetical protein C8R40DRAFT_1174149 [Lentinula edodes]